MIIFIIFIFVAAVFRFVAGALILCGKLDCLTEGEKHKNLIGICAVLSGAVLACIGTVLLLTSKPPLVLIICSVAVTGIACSIPTLKRDDENREK